MVTIPMCEVLEDLDPDHFMRIHRSYVVNLEHIDAIAVFHELSNNHTKLQKVT